MDYLHYHLRFKKLIFRYNQKPPRVSLDHVIYELIWMFDNNDNRHVTIAVRRIQRQSRKWLCLFKSADISKLIANEPQLPISVLYLQKIGTLKIADIVNLGLQQLRYFASIPLRPCPNLKNTPPIPRVPRQFK
jgi:hypothetical protein